MVQTDTIFPDQEIRDWEHLNSANNVFRLQFFSPGTNKNRYLGIFYNLPPNLTLYDNDKRSVWVANRDFPIPDSSGSLMIDADGKFKISHGEGKVTLLYSAPAGSNISARLLDNGNLVLQELNNSDGSAKQILWQSFDYPTDTFLPGMKLGFNFKTGQKWLLSAWISDQVPTSGSITLGGDPNRTSQLMIWWRGNLLWSSEIWQYGLNGFSYDSDQEGEYWMYSASERHILARYTLDSFGVVHDRFGNPIFGGCGSTSFRAGCVEEILPECRRHDLFLEYDLWFDKMQGFVFGDSIVLDKNSYSLFDCRAKCKSSCACVAYASVSENGTGCEVWNQVKIDSADIEETRWIFVLHRKG